MAMTDRLDQFFCNFLPTDSNRKVMALLEESIEVIVLRKSGRHDLLGWKSLRDEIKQDRR